MMEWLIGILIWLAADHDQISLDRARAAASVGTAYASMQELPVKAR